MKLIEVKCTNCGASLQIESNKKQITCQYCGNNFLLDDNSSTVHHLMSGEISEEQEYINARTALNKLQDYDVSYNYYLSLSKRYIDNYEVWIGLLRSMTHDFTYKIDSKYFEDEYMKYWKNFVSLAPDEEVAKYSRKYQDYYKMKGQKISTPEYSNTASYADYNLKNINEGSIIMILVIFFLGCFGVHKFIRGQMVMGVIYLFTLGLFGIGWIIDLIIEIRKCLN